MDEQMKKRVRRTADQLRADKISALEEKIQKREEEIAALKKSLEELKRPPQLSNREKQQLFRQKILDGVLTEDEAYQLGYRG